MSGPDYVGRFAPSPTGPLHQGSLVAAVASYLEARARAGLWLLRIDDVDTPRTVPGAADSILEALAAHALRWDGDVVYQSSQAELYQDALHQLSSAQQTYACSCSRKQLVNGRYPGICREGMQTGAQARSVRVKTGEEPVQLNDRLQGHYQQNLWTEVGDFVVHRADGLVAYHLATVVDDAAQGVTDIVRGVDLLESTPRQIHLQKLLRLPTPGYAHVPVLENEQGQKLSKQTGAAAVDFESAGANVRHALEFLGHPPPTELNDSQPEALLAWAVDHWDLDRVPRTGHS